MARRRRGVPAAGGAMALLVLPAAILIAGCGGSSKKEEQTVAEWLRENTVLLDDLASFENEKRHAAIARFLHLGKERGTEVVNYLLNDPKLDDYRIEVVLARILAEWKDSRAIPKLLLNMKVQDRGAMEMAKEGLIAFGDNPQILEAMREGIADPDAGARRAAAEVLSEMSGPEAKKILADRFKVEEDLEIRGICLLGILAMSPREPLREEFLVIALGDPDLGIRQQAWEGLLRLRPPPPVRFEPGGDPVERLQAIAALKRWTEARRRTATAPGRSKDSTKDKDSTKEQP